MAHKSNDCTWNPALSKEPRHPIFHVPHDGHLFPKELTGDICIPEALFMAYHHQMRDQDVGMMVPCSPAGDRVSFPVSRLLCDVERLIGPEEIMEQYGMGFCYEKAFDGRVIKHISENGRKAARWYYDRHHRHINDLCDRHSRVLFFDMHSYSDAIIPPFARRPGTETPDLCIGTDPRFTPKQLKDTVQGLFAQAGFSTGENTPYEGLYVPENILAGQSGCDFIGIMLEFNRGVYCTPAGQTDKARVTLICSLIGRVLADCINL